MKCKCFISILQVGNGGFEKGNSFPNNALVITYGEAFQVLLVLKNPSTDSGDVRVVGLIPESGRAFRGGHSNPIHYSCLENPMDRGVTCDIRSQRAGHS